MWYLAHKLRQNPAHLAQPSLTAKDKQSRLGSLSNVLRLSSAFDLELCGAVERRPFWTLRCLAKVVPENRRDQNRR
jgi:hypothetical protein